MKKIKSWFTLLNFIILMIPVLIALCAFGILPAWVLFVHLFILLILFNPTFFVE